MQFIGGMYKVGYGIKEHQLHECIITLMADVKYTKTGLAKIGSWKAIDEEERIELLCKLLTTVGEKLDSKSASAHSRREMNKYFARVKELHSTEKKSRMRF